MALEIRDLKNSGQRKLGGGLELNLRTENDEPVPVILREFVRRFQLVNVQNFWGLELPPLCGFSVECWMNAIDVTQRIVCALTVQMPSAVPLHGLRRGSYSVRMERITAV